MSLVSLVSLSVFPNDSATINLLLKSFDKYHLFKYLNVHSMFCLTASVGYLPSFSSYIFANDSILAHFFSRSV